MAGRRRKWVRNPKPTSSKTRAHFGIPFSRGGEALSSRLLFMGDRDGDGAPIKRIAIMVEIWSTSEAVTGAVVAGMVIIVATRILIRATTADVRTAQLVGIALTP